jgi:hypothetical protein
MPSSVIRFHVYDPKDRALTIVFQTGRIYIYDDVPPQVADGLERAESKGEYFNAHIKDRYRFRKKK